MVVEGVGARCVVDGLEFWAFAVVEGVVTDWFGVVAAPAVDGARVALSAMPAPRVVATPRLAHPTKRRLRDAGWGRERRVMGLNLRMRGETGVKGG